MGGRGTPDGEAAAGEHGRLRQRLLAFFESHGSLDPGRDADEALDRLASKLGEGYPIRDVPGYLHGLARSLLREARPRRRREEGEAGAACSPPSPPAASPGECLDRCLAELDPERAELLAAYGAAARGPSRAWRAELAAKRGLSASALRLLVFRAREAVRKGLARCLAERGRA